MAWSIPTAGHAWPQAFGFTSPIIQSVLWRDQHSGAPAELTTPRPSKARTLEPILRKHQRCECVLQNPGVQLGTDVSSFTSIAADLHCIPVPSSWQE